MLNSTMISPNQCTAGRPSIGGFGQNIDPAQGDGDSMVTTVLVTSTSLAIIPMETIHWYFISKGNDIKEVACTEWLTEFKSTIIFKFSRVDILGNFQDCKWSFQNGPLIKIRFFLLILYGNTPLVNHFVEGSFCAIQSTSCQAQYVRFPIDPF